MKQKQQMKVFKLSKDKRYSFQQLEEDTSKEPLQPNGGAKEYTEDEVHELLNANPFAQSQIDKRIRGAVETNTAKLKKEFEKTLQEKREEWETESRLAKEGVELSDDDVVKKLQKQVYELTRQNMMKEAKAILISKNIPEFFTNFVTGKDEAETAQNIEALSEVLTEYSASVKKQNLRGVTPKATAQTELKEKKKMDIKTLENMSLDEIRETFK